MFWFRARFSDVEIDLFFHFFLNDPAISQIILDEEELKAKQVCNVSNSVLVWYDNFFGLQLEEDNRRLSAISIGDEPIAVVDSDNDEGIIL